MPIEKSIIRYESQTNRQDTQMKGNSNRNTYRDSMALRIGIDINVKTEFMTGTFYTYHV